MNHEESLIANANLSVEEFDGETVLLDVTRGLYFSLGGAATALWRAFGEPRRVVDVTETLYGQLADADREALRDAIQSMRDHDLLLPAPEAPFGGGTPLVRAATPFAVPKVEAFDDLADLISIDPVHDVNAAAGWPVRPAGLPDAG